MLISTSKLSIDIDKDNACKTSAFINVYFDIDYKFNRNILNNIHLCFSDYIDRRLKIEARNRVQNKFGFLK